MKNNKGKIETYIGLASKFKSRYYKHKASLENFTSENSTTLSTQYWEEKNHGNQPVVSWKILERNISIFNPVVQKCNLCTREKFNIIFNSHLCYKTVKLIFLVTIAGDISYSI